ncbi:response regulator, partial [Romboutsia maritimum]
MKRVLIVDDAAFMRMSIKNMLSNYDFEIVGEAEN